MRIQFDTARTLQALRLVTFTLLIENVQLNSNIWIISGNTPVIAKITRVVFVVKRQAKIKTIQNERVQCLLLPVANEIYVCLFSKKKVEKVFRWRHWKKKKYETQNYSMKIDWNAAAHIFFKEFRFFYPLRSKIFTAFILVIRYESRTLLIFDEREKKRWQFVLRFSFVCRMQFV